MRNAIISTIAFAMIILYSFFSFFYLGSFVGNFRNSIKSIEPEGINNVACIEKATDILESKKNMLLLMISKEHINTIENSLTSLSTAIKFEEPQDIDEYKALLLNSINNVDRYNHTIN